MLRFGEVHFIYASTNYLHTLSEAFRRRGIVPAEAFPMMRAIHIVAEGYPLEWARGIEQFWGCRLHEGYGSTQGRASSRRPARRASSATMVGAA